MLQLENVSAGYGTNAVISGIDLSLDAGETVAEVGVIVLQDAESERDRSPSVWGRHRVTSSVATEPPTGRGLVTVNGWRPSGRLDE